MSKKYKVIEKYLYYYLGDEFKYKKFDTDNLLNRLSFMNEKLKIRIILHDRNESIHLKEKWQAVLSEYVGKDYKLYYSIPNITIEQMVIELRKSKLSKLDEV
jgi:hypothetical protein